MIIKYFDPYEGIWLDIEGQSGSTLEYNDASGWVSTGGYLKYIAQISQYGTDVPEVTILENNFPFTPYWEYYDNGIYGFNFEDMDINYNKLIHYLSQNFSNNSNTWIEYQTIYDITLYASKGDDNLIKQTIEIRYYN